MGRTIKISELKKFDVFSFDGHNRFVCMRADNDGFAYSSMEGDGDFYQRKFELEVELLGQMEFKEE